MAQNFRNASAQSFWNSKLFIFSATGTVESEPGSISKSSAFAVLMTATVVCLASILFRPVAVYIPDGVRLVASLGRHPRTSDGDRLLGGIVPEAVWLSIYPDQEELRALRYLRARTSIADAIFVGVPVNSKVDRNSVHDLRIYWLAGRKIGVRTFELEPGKLNSVLTRSCTMLKLVSGKRRNYLGRRNWGERV